MLFLSLSMSLYIVVIVFMFLGKDKCVFLNIILRINKLHWIEKNEIKYNENIFADFSFMHPINNCSAFSKAKLKTHRLARPCPPQPVFERLFESEDPK